MSNLSNVAEIFNEAKLKHRAAVEAKKAMADVMLRAFQLLIPAGMLLDLRVTNGVPSYFWRVRTLAGNDRGTKVFRIVKVVSVDVNPEYPDLSTWIADAIPVSEKTGQDMKGSAGNGIRRNTVRLHGNVGCELCVDEPVGVSAERLIEILSKQLAVAEEQ